MRVLLTGGSGDLGSLLRAQLLSRGDDPINLDVIQPADAVGEFIQGSILDIPLLASLLPNVDSVVHIAAWHGIHEFKKERDAFEFWQLNATGTLTLLECCARTRCTKFIFISSTSIDEWPALYAHSKLVGEELMRTYAARHHMQIITLRPRGFIPHWNRTVYSGFPEWARWYWQGAVHISDVAQSVMRALDALTVRPTEEYPALVIDGACDFSEQQLSTWDSNGPGSTFREHFGEQNYRLAVRNGLDPAQKPKILGFVEAQKAIGYAPTYAFAQMLAELAAHVKR